MWWAMAMQDIKMHYRGSLLGPFWLNINMVVMIAAIGLIYARLFHMEINRLQSAAWRSSKGITMAF
jgi:ABC-type polysaccharide/polyol phosphate export permease